MITWLMHLWGADRALPTVEPRRSNTTASVVGAVVALGVLAACSSPTQSTGLPAASTTGSVSSPQSSSAASSSPSPSPTQSSSSRMTTSSTLTASSISSGSSLSTSGSAGSSPALSDDSAPSSGPQVLPPSASGRTLGLSDIFATSGEWKEQRYDISDTGGVFGMATALSNCNSNPESTQLELRLAHHFAKMASVLARPTIPRPLTTR